MKYIYTEVKYILRHCNYTVLFLTSPFEINADNVRLKFSLFVFVFVKGSAAYINTKTQYRQYNRQYTHAQDLISVEQ